MHIFRRWRPTGNRKSLGNISNFTVQNLQTNVSPRMVPKIRLAETLKKIREMFPISRSLIRKKMFHEDGAQLEACCQNVELLPICRFFCTYSAICGNPKELGKYLQFHNHKLTKNVSQSMAPNMRMTEKLKKLGKFFQFHSFKSVKNVSLRIAPIHEAGWDNLKLASYFPSFFLHIFHRRPTWNRKSLGSISNFTVLNP